MARNCFIYPGILLVLSIIGSITACRKKDSLPDTIPAPPDSQQQRYGFVGKAVVQPPLLYTQSGVVDDSATVWAYLQRRAWQTLFVTTDSVAIQDSVFVYVLDPTTMAFVTGSDSLAATQIDVQGQTITLEQNRPIQYQKTIFNDGPCDSLLHASLKAAPRRKLEQLNTGPGGSPETWITAYPRLILQANGQSWMLPMLQVAIYSGATNCVRLQSKIWNLPQQDIRGALKVGDTLVAQLSTIQLGKQ